MSAIIIACIQASVEFLKSSALQLRSKPRQPGARTKQAHLATSRSNARPFRR